MSRADSQSLAAEAIAGFLRALAARAERDAVFAQALGEVLAESGFAFQRVQVADQTSTAKRPAKARRSPPSQAQAESPLDPFALYRERGESSLASALASLDVPALRAIIRTYRLDPARISARWTGTERLAGLIVKQVQAQAGLGRAFSRV